MSGRLPNNDSIVEEQVAYHRARALEYDERLKELHRYITLGGSLIGPTEDSDGDYEIALALGQLNRRLPVGQVLELV